MRHRVKIMIGMGLILALCLSLQTAVFAATNYYGPQEIVPLYSKDKYYVFGDGSQSNKSQNGLTLNVDASSISYQSVKATLTMDYQLIQDRSITKFIILANGVYVDYVTPYWDTDQNVWSEYYYLDINITDQYIGSDVYFQAVALHTETSGAEYVVAWSQETPTYAFKAFPVTDSDTHGLLAAILQKLQEIKDTLSSKLDAVKKAVEDIYTPSPAAEAKMHSSIDNFMDKLPTTEMAKEVSKITDALEDSRKKLNQPGSTMTFGQQFDLVPGEGIYIYILDLTEWQTEAKLFRTIMQAALWLWFFQALFAWLSPKMGI
ncbi:hypothetical protein [Paenibacillus sp. y28]|uniref:hypothetical protein n=1 Tax=Paenibacillus sp. y28 TaxID=3129110 RepID=UPI00301AEAD4